MSIPVAGQPHEIPAGLQVPASGLDAEAAHVPQANVRVCSHPAPIARPAGSSSPSKPPTTTHWLPQDFEIVKQSITCKLHARKRQLRFITYPETMPARLNTHQT